MPFIIQANKKKDASLTCKMSTHSFGYIATENTHAAINLQLSDKP